MIAPSIIPDWESLHPVVNHMAVVLLLVTPLFIVIGAALPPPRGRSWLLAGLFLLALGTGTLLMAIPTGHAAAQFAARHPDVQAALAAHESLASEARGIFVMLLILYVSVMLAPRVIHQNGRLFSTVLPLSFLLLYGAGVMVLLDTAHRGNWVAHELGVHAVDTLDTNHALGMQRAEIR
jgi:uncharacterized membrane protein